MGDFIRTVDAKGITNQFSFIANQEGAFWIRARRNRLLANWFSDLTDENDQSYLKLLLDTDFARVESHEAESWILTKVGNDLRGFGIFLSRHQLRDVFHHCELQARLEHASH